VVQAAWFLVVIQRLCEGYDVAINTTHQQLLDAASAFFGANARCCCGRRRRRRGRQAAQWGCTFHHRWRASRVRRVVDMHLIREAFLKQHHLPPLFDFGRYLVHALTGELGEVLEISPPSWLVALAGVWVAAARGETKGEEEYITFAVGGAALLLFNCSILLVTDVAWQRAVLHSSIACDSTEIGVGAGDALAPQLLADEIGGPYSKTEASARQLVQVALCAIKLRDCTATATSEQLDAIGVLIDARNARRKTKDDDVALGELGARQAEAQNPMYAVARDGAVPSRSGRRGGLDLHSSARSLPDLDSATQATQSGLDSMGIDIVEESGEDPFKDPSRFTERQTPARSKLRQQGAKGKMAASAASKITSLGSFFTMTKSVGRTHRLPSQINQEWDLREVWAVRSTAIRWAIEIGFLLDCLFKVGGSAGADPFASAWR